MNSGHALENIKVSLILKRIESFVRGYRQNIMVLANDSRETSYLIDKYIDGVPVEGTVIARSGTGHQDRRSFFRNLAHSLMANALNRCLTFDELINAAGTVLPSTAEFIKNSLKKTNPDFLDATEMLNIFITESGRRCIFIIEEFHALKEIFPCCFEDFSKFIILQRQCMVMLTTSAEKASDKILNTELNLLFGNFERITIDRGHFAENCRHIARAVKNMSPSDLPVYFFESVIGDNSLYLNYVFDALSGCRTDDDKVFIATLLTEKLYKRDTYLHQRFIQNVSLLENTHKIPVKSLNILVAVASGYTRKSELFRINSGDTKNICARLNKLCEQGFLTDHGALYAVNDRFFAFWLTHIFRYAGIGNPLVRRAMWDRAIGETIDTFKASLDAGSNDKIIDLLASFQDDSLFLGAENYKFSRMQRTKFIPRDHDGIDLIVGEGKDIIFMGVKDSDAQDTDVFNFTKKSNCVKGRGVKKIFISLGEIPDNARLTAKNHRLISWDINELNRLMKLYNKAVVPLKGTP